jgi:hypothetical protein
MIRRHNPDLSHGDLAKEFGCRFRAHNGGKRTRMTVYLYRTKKSCESNGHAESFTIVKNETSPMIEKKCDHYEN